MKHLATLLASCCASFSVNVHADPLLTSWATGNSGKYARVYTTTANRTSGTSATTWNTGGATLPHTSPSYSDVYEVSYSASWVYTKYTGLPSYVTGPWLNPQGNVGNFWPGTQSVIRRFPRSPAVQAGTKDSTAAGTSGIFVNGVAAFNALDGQAWDGTQIQGGAQHTNGTYYWHRNAPVAEGYNFDYALGHQLPAGLYHNHQNPIALRYQLGDHVDYNSSTKVYTESAAAVTAHSPILGWAHDGYPVYGPYGYGTATDSGSAVRRMVSGYVKRNGGTTGVDTVTSNTTTMPAWYTRYRTNHSLTNATPPARSTNTTTYPIGTFAQDWSYLGDLIKTGSAYYQQGADFDLDEYNCRYCVTPEYPAGTYAYFITIDSSNASTYPYVFAFEFMGNATGGTVGSISESVTSQMVGGAATPITYPSTPGVTSGTVTLIWNSAEGSSYTVENSTNQSSWTTRSTGLAATSNSTTNSSFPAIGSTGTEYARVTRTALASYDQPAVASAVTTSQTATTTYSAGNTAPTLTTVSTLTGAFKNAAFTISHATLAAAANEADPEGDTLSFRVEAVSSGTLTRNSVAVTPGTTLLSTGESLVWTPGVNATGTLAAFTVKAHDGSLASSTAVAVNVTVANANTVPTLTSISTLAGATEDTAFTVSYATLAAAANEADLDGDTVSFRIEAVSSGTLTKNSVAVTPGTTLLSAGEDLVWTPAANANGTLAAFTVKAWDGTAASTSAITVNISTAAVNDLPTLTTISTLTGALKNSPFTVSYATLAAAANDADADGDSVLFRVESVTSGILTRYGVAVTPGSTLLASGESLVWTPATDATGTLAAFTIKAFDGTAASATVVTVNITVSTSTIGDPQLTSWYTARSGRYARLVETDTELTNDSTKTTWTYNSLSQTSPVYAGPQQVDYSASWIYLRTPDLATYTMGPWYNDAARTTHFVNIPKNQGLIVKLPRSSTLAAIPSTKTQTMGYNFGGALQDGIGWYVDGVAVFDPLDGYSYNAGSESQGGAGQWHRDAYVNEGITFDKGLAHQQNTGKYHNHANPIALRYQLGDAVSFNNTTKAYTETMSPAGHSPIIGWMLDGLPIYGPYGYSSALDANSGVRRMVSGLVKRDGTTTGVDNISTTGSARALPAWALRNNGNVSASGPNVSTTYPFGRYIEDWAYMGDLIKTGSTYYQQGTDFDLNEYNVRYCKTPEFPNGTYAYFLNISSTGTPQFPYLCNRWFYGTPNGGTVTTISETVTNQFTGGANSALSYTGAPSVSSGTVTLTWNAVEGGTYSVDASSDNSTWTSKATGLTVSNANTKSNAHTTLGSSGTEYARVNRTALATYDSTGTVAATVSQSAVTAFPAGNTAPTLTTISTLTGATEDTAFTITYADLAAAADEADVDGNAIYFRIETVSGGTLTKDSVDVTAGSTLLSAGENLVWTPASNANGTVAAFTVKVYDGSLASATAVTVNVSVAAVSDAPTLTAVSTLTGATEDIPFTITHATLAAAADEGDADGDAISFRIETVSSGTLTKNSVAVTAGTTLLSTGESLVWTPASNANGTLAAFTVTAYDGSAASAPPVGVNVLVTAVNDVPTLATISTLTGATEDSAFNISYATLAAAADEADVETASLSFRVESVSSGTLTKNSVAVTPGSTLLSTGETLVWTPAANANGTLSAFTVTAWDGSAASAAPVTVYISVADVADYRVWSGGAGTGSWGTASNWSSNVVPLSGDHLDFNGASPFGITLEADRVVGSLKFSGNSAYTLSGNTLTTGSGGTLVSESPASGTLTHTIASSVSFGGAATADLETTGQLQLSGTVSGSTLSKIGAGTLIVSGTATMSGPTTVSVGTLQIGNNGTTGTFNGDIVNNSTLVFKRSNLHDYTGVISGTGTVIQNGGSNVRLAGENTFTGTLAVLTGNVAIGNGGSGGSVATSSIYTNGNVIFNRNTDSAYEGVISGPGTVYKVNTNTLTLSGSNTYSGQTNIEGGAVLFSATANLGTGAGFLRLSSGTLKWASGNTADVSLRADGTTARTVTFDAGGATFDTNGNNVTLVNPVGNSGTGAFTKAGAGTLVLAGNATHTGGTSVASGTLQLGNGGTDGGLANSNVIVASGATLALNRSDSVTLSGVIAGAGGLAKIGSSSLTLTGANTATGTLSFTAGHVTIGNGGTSGSWAGNVTVSNALTALEFNRSDDLAYPGVMTGAGGVQKYGSGKLTLTSGGHAMGSLHVMEGSLEMTAGSSLFASFNVASGTSLSVSPGVTLQTASLGLGENGSQGGTVTIGSGASLVVTSVLDLGKDSGTDTLTLSPGAIFTSPSAYLAEESGTTGIVNVNGATWTNSGELRQSDSENTDTTVLLNITGGGSVSASRISATGSWTTTLDNGTFIFTGSGSSSNSWSLGVGGGTVSNTNAMALSGVISGSGALTKTGAGTLTLTGANTYTGNTSVSAGTLSLTSGTLADASTASLATGATLDLGFAGTDTVNAFYLNGVLQASGTWGSLTSSAAHKTAQITGAGLLSVTTGAAGFDSWATAAGLSGNDALATADPDGDGISNTLEYALGLTPTGNDGASRLPHATSSGSVFVLSFIRPTTIPTGASYGVQKLTDLGGTWTDATPGTDYVETTQVNGDGTTTVTITSSSALSSGAKQFLRLAVTVN